MNKPELVKALMERTKAPKDVAADFVNALFATITEELKQGNEVSLNNFGTFYLTRHKDRVTAHPTSREQISLPPLTVAKFRPSSKLKNTINKHRA